MLGLIPLSRQFQVTSGSRHFSTSLILQLARKNKQSQIRVPSKKALAAKAKRRAASAAKEEATIFKLPLVDAIKVLQSVEVGRPNSLYELYIKTELGSGTAVPRGRVALPREAKPKPEDKILVFAEGRKADEAKAAGAHIVGGLELVDGILSNRIRATTIICTPALIRAITPKLGRFLGPLGLMPSERRGTVTDDISGFIKRLHGSTEWRADKFGNIRTPIAAVGFPVSDVLANIREFMLSVKRATGHAKDPDNPDTKLKNSGGARPITPIKKIILSSRQGPGIRIADAM